MIGKALFLFGFTALFAFAIFSCLLVVNHSLLLLVCSVSFGLVEMEGVLPTPDTSARAQPLSLNVPVAADPAVEIADTSLDTDLASRNPRG